MIHVTESGSRSIKQLTFRLTRQPYCLQNRGSGAETNKTPKARRFSSLIKEKEKKEKEKKEGAQHIDKTKKRKAQH